MILDVTGNGLRKISNYLSISCEITQWNLFKFSGFLSCGTYMNWLGYVGLIVMVISARFRSKSLCWSRLACLQDISKMFSDILSNFQGSFMHSQVTFYICLWSFLAVYEEDSISSVSFFMIQNHIL